MLAALGPRTSRVSADPAAALAHNERTAEPRERVGSQRRHHAADDWNFGRYPGQTGIVVTMEIIPISEAKDRLTELADRAAREHDHFTLTRNGRPHAVIVSVAERESLQETPEILADPQMRADLVEAASAEARGDVTTEEEMAAIMASRLGRASA